MCTCYMQTYTAVHSSSFAKLMQFQEAASFSTNVKICTELSHLLNRHVVEVWHCHKLLTAGKGCPTVRLHARSEAHALQGCCLPDFCTTQATALILVEAFRGVHALHDLLQVSCDLVTSCIGSLCML